jgi:hypothetical protein
MNKAISTVTIIGLFAVGAGGGYYYLKHGRSGGATQTPPADTGSSGLHGKSVVIPANAVICPEHNVPEAICPFCKPSLIEELGHCGQHDVAEALCTRCNPTLIAAFKVENDWCAEHGLPESQCLICNPAEDEG